jgi:hypothetical protein
MAAAAGLFLLPSLLNQFGVGEQAGAGYGNEGGYSDAPPDYQESVEAVRRQQEEGQKAVNQLGEAFKAHNEGLVKRITKTEAAAVHQLNKQKEEFQKKTVDVKDIKMPGLDPNVLLYGGVAFGIMALFIVMKK